MQGLNDVIQGDRPFAAAAKEGAQISRAVILVVAHQIDCRCHALRLRVASSVWVSVVRKEKWTRSGRVQVFSVISPPFTGPTHSLPAQMDSPINNSALTSALANLQLYRNSASIRNLIAVCSEKTQAHFANDFAEVCRDTIAVLNDKLASLEGFHETLACMSAHDVETIVSDVEWAFAQMHWSQLIDSSSVANIHGDLRCEEWFSIHDKPDLLQYRNEYQMCHDKVGQVMMLHHPMLIDSNLSCNNVRINAGTVCFSTEYERYTDQEADRGWRHGISAPYPKGSRRHGAPGGQSHLLHPHGRFWSNLSHQPIILCRELMDQCDKRVCCLDVAR